MSAASKPLPINDYARTMKTESSQSVQIPRVQAGVQDNGNDKLHTILADAIKETP